MDVTESAAAMAEAIERRRLELGMTIGDLADAAGLTRQGLDPVRRGELRNYNDRTIMGVARALRWQLDWYDRIRADEEPLPSSEGRGLDARSDADSESWDDLKSSLSEEDRAVIRAMIERLQAKQR